MLSQKLSRYLVFVLISILPCVSVQAQNTAKKTWELAKAFAEKEGWKPTAEKMKAFSVQNYERGAYDQAIENYYLYLWCQVMAEQKADMDSEFLDYAMREKVFSESFWNLISEKDDFKMVMTILCRLYKNDSTLFNQYQNLALAIAVVYDQQPSSSNWPHFQVGSQARNSIPQGLPDPLEAFNFFVERDTKLGTLYRLPRLSAGELKFVVDVTASFDELMWVRTKVKLNISDLNPIYQGIKYDMARLEAGKYSWTDNDYRLQNIYKKGGICIDQAYFTTQVCKVNGVPSISISGSGKDGYHAWVGYYKRGNWDFSVGRYESDNYLSGSAFDPQTWKEVSDHAIDYLIEPFRKTDDFKRAKIHLAFAKLYLDTDGEKAVKAAQAAVKLSPLYDEAWDLYISASGKNKTDAKDYEAALQEAIKALSKYVEIQSVYVDRLSKSYKDRGETQLAHDLQVSMAKKMARKRSDLSIELASDALREVIKEKGIDQGFMEYKSTLMRFKSANGTDLVNNIVQPFVVASVDANNRKLAMQAVKYAQDKIPYERGSQLEEQFDEIMRYIDPNSVKKKK